MNGILNILKPPGMTSHDVVSFIRRTLKVKKVGHTGTLDPGAAGVLPICLGKATKVCEYITNQDKEYICEITFGNETDTYDKYGEFKYEIPKDYSHITLEMIKAKLEDFKGEIEQTPPSYSAIRINGKRAYSLAREGMEFEVPKRKVTVSNIEILGFSLPKIMLKINCSKGTYIRSICKDLGDALGVPSYMSFLIRTKTGDFSIEYSSIMQNITKDNVEKLLYPIYYALNMKEVFIEEKYSDKILNGNPVLLQGDFGVEKNEKVKAFIKPNKFIGVGHVTLDNMFKVDKLMI